MQILSSGKENKRVEPDFKWAKQFYEYLQVDYMKFIGVIKR